MILQFCNRVISIDFPLPTTSYSFQRKIKRGAAEVSQINFQSCEVNNEMDENGVK